MPFAYCTCVAQMFANSQLCRKSNLKDSSMVEHLGSLLAIMLPCCIGLDKSGLVQPGLPPQNVNH